MMSMVRYISFIFLIYSWSGLVQAEHGLFTIGVIAEREGSIERAFRQYGPLHKYLAKKLNEKNIEIGPLVVVKDLHDMANKLESGNVDAIFESVVTTHKINDISDKNTLSPSLLGWRKGQRQYHSVFFVRKDSDIKSLNDLQGKKIVFESGRSTSAFFVPRAIIKQQGLSLWALGTHHEEKNHLLYEFAGSELNQAYWVHRGKSDVGAFNNGDWLRIPEKVRQDLRIIYQTKPIVRWLFSINDVVDKAIRLAVEDVLLAAHEDDEGKTALETASRISKFEMLNTVDLENIEYWKGAFKE